MRWLRVVSTLRDKVMDVYCTCGKLTKEEVENILSSVPGNILELERYESEGMDLYKSKDLRVRHLFYKI